MILRAGLLLSVLMASGASAAQAQTSNQQPGGAPSKDPAIAAAERMRAKKRLYPGGRDEESLTVQAQLINPTKGQVEEPAEPSTDHD